MASFGEVGIGTTIPDASAALDVSSSSKGLLIPQMTQAQPLAIDKPATGLLVIRTDGVAGAGIPADPNWLNLAAYTLQQNINTNGKWVSHNGSDSGLAVTQQGLGIGTSSANGRLTVQQAAGQPRVVSLRDEVSNPVWDMSLVNDNLQFVEPTRRSLCATGTCNKC